MAQQPSPPPINQLPFVDIRGGVGYLSHVALDFLTKLWNLINQALQLPLYGFATGMPAAGAVLASYLMTGNERFPAALTGNQGAVVTAPTLNAVFPIEVNGVQVGNATVLAGTTAMLWTLAVGYNSQPGDVLRFLAPNPQDATLAGPSFTFVGTVG
jgi:hypothetical protein